MNKLQLALQTWTVHKQLKSNPEEVLRQIKHIGFTHLELAGNAGFSPIEFSKICSKYKFEVIGIHQPPLIAGKKVEVDEIRRHAKAYGSKYVTIMLGRGEENNERIYLEYADLCSKVGKALKQDDITLCYHCYNFDLVPIAGSTNSKSGLDILLENSLDEHLAVELDTYFIYKAGVDLETVFRKCGSRCKIVHVDDFDDKGQHAPLGKGIIPWERTINIIWEDCAPAWFVLEHLASKPMAWIKESYVYWSQMRMD